MFLSVSYEVKINVHRMNGTASVRSLFME